MGKVYLICFDRKFYHCKHYIGYTDIEVERRLERHKAGHGSCLLRAVKNAGIDFKVTRVWEDKNRHFERKLKKQKNSKRFCPYCNGRGE